MKILEIFGEPISSGGQESFVNSVILNLPENKFQIDLFTPYFCDNQEYKKNVENKGGKLYEGHLDFRPGKSRSNIVDPIVKQLKSVKYDVVHVHSGSISVLTLAAKCAKKNGVEKVIVHSHCGIEKITLKNILLRNIMSLSLNKYADIFCACSKTAGEAKFTKKIVENKLHIINNGVDFKVFNHSKKENERIRKIIGADKDTFVVGHVGRFSYQKNHDFLLEIFNEIRKRKSNCILLLIGDGELKKEIIGKTRELGLSDSVHFAGNVNNVNEYMQAMDVFVLPSRFEGLPIVGVEAQASGIETFVSTNVSRELMLTKHIHYLNLDDPQSWSDAILGFSDYSHYDSRKELQEKGYDIHLTASYLSSMYMDSE